MIRKNFKLYNNGDFINITLIYRAISNIIELCAKKRPHFVIGKIESNVGILYSYAKNEGLPYQEDKTLETSTLL